MLKLLGAYFHHCCSRIFQLVPSKNQKRFVNVNKKGLYRGRFYQAERRDTVIQLYWTQTRSSLGLCTELCADPSILWIKICLCTMQPSKVSACLFSACRVGVQSWGCISQVLPVPRGYHQSPQQPVHISWCFAAQALWTFESIPITCFKWAKHICLIVNSSLDWTSCI